MNMWVMPLTNFQLHDNQVEVTAANFSGIGSGPLHVTMPSLPEQHVSIPVSLRYLLDQLTPPGGQKLPNTIYTLSVASPGQYCLGIFMLNTNAELPTLHQPWSFSYDSGYVINASLPKEREVKLW